MGDRLGIPGAVSFFALFQKSTGLFSHFQGFRKVNIEYGDWGILHDDNVFTVNPQIVEVDIAPPKKCFLFFGGGKGGPV